MLTSGKYRIIILNSKEFESKTTKKESYSKIVAKISSD